MEALGYFEMVLAVICFLYLWKLRYDDGLPRNWPLVGMLPWLLCVVNRIHEIVTEILGPAGGTFLFKGPWFANMDMLITVDPANVHYILSSNFQNFPKGASFMKIFDVLGNGIVNSDTFLWRNQRKHAQVLLNHDQFNKFLAKSGWEKLEKGLIQVLDHISKQNLVVDIQDLFQRLTFDTTCMFVTGYDPGCLSTEFAEVPFAKAMDDAEEVIVTRHLMPQCVWKLLRWLNIGSEKKMSEARKTIDHVIYTYISKKRKELSSGRIESNDRAQGADLLTLYINEDDDTLGLKGNDMFLRDILLNHMIAGRDTTSSALTWFLWLVITHQQVETKIREELKAIIIPEDEAEKFRLFSKKELTKLAYLHGALCEALRLYPPVPFQHKEPLKPDILPSGHHVNPTMKVIFCLFAMGRMVSVWGKDCLEFKPERWISERGSIKHEPSYKFLAFNAGPRTCLGKDVAFTQMKSVAAAIIHNYQVQLVEGHPVAPNLSMILYMKHGLKVRVSKRLP